MSLGAAGGQIFDVMYTIVRKHVNVKAGEEILILTDTETNRDVAIALASACKALYAEPVIMTLPASYLKERDLTKTALEAMKGADVYIPLAPTIPKCIHKVDIARFLGEGVFRMFYIGGCGMWVGDVPALILKAQREHDYEDVYKVSRALANWLADKKELHVTSKMGTDFRCSIEGIWATSPKGPQKGPYRWVGGIVREKGEIGGIPDGEAWGGPREGTAEGIIVIDGPISRICYKPQPSEPVKLKVKDGRVVEVEGGIEAKYIRRYIETVEGFDVIAEVSFGTNRWCTEITGSIDAWDKHIAGTMHIALGENRFQIYPYGTNECELHVDMLLRAPTATVDGVTILKEGQLQYNQFMSE